MDLSATNALSARERDCLRLVASGLQTKEIAQRLQIAPDTVNEYIASARLKLGAPNRRAAARLLAAAEALPPWLGDEPLGVSADHRGPAEPWPTPERGWSSWPFPVRRHGEVNNVLGITARLVWILVITMGIAIAFGMLTSGLKVLADLFGNDAYLRQ